MEWQQIVKKGGTGASTLMMFQFTLGRAGGILGVLRKTIKAYYKKGGIILLFRLPYPRIIGIFLVLKDFQSTMSRFSWDVPDSGPPLKLSTVFSNTSSKL